MIARIPPPNPDYFSTTTTNTTEAELVNKVNELAAQVEELEKEHKGLQSRLVTIDTIKQSDADCLYFVNLPNYKVFTALCDYLACNDLKYWQGASADRELDGVKARSCQNVHF